jgi:hypothetical protein
MHAPRPSDAGSRPARSTIPPQSPAPPVPRTDPVPIVAALAPPPTDDATAAGSLDAFWSSVTTAGSPLKHRHGDGTTTYTFL